MIHEPVTETIGGYRFTVSFADREKPALMPDTIGHGGMIIHVGPEEYLVAGQGITVSVQPVGDGPPLAGIDNAAEG